MLAPSPIERGADCNTERYPNGLSGKHKTNRPYSGARAYPVTSDASVSGFFIHGMLRTTSFNRHAFSQITRLINISAPRYGHVIRQQLQSDGEYHRAGKRTAIGHFEHLAIGS